jgi:small-conductance mechanosensitive channel
MAAWRAMMEVMILGNSLGTWLLALGIFLITFTLLPILRRFIAAHRRSRASETATVHVAVELGALLAERTSRLFLWGLAVWFASRDLALSPRAERWLTVALVLLFWMQMALWTMRLLRFAIDQRRLRSTGPDTLVKSSMEVILFAAGLLVWSIAFLLALDTLGIQIKPLLAGLGIGGIALALAVQTVLGDLLASLSIALDKPFGIGDGLTVDDIQGTVEHIGVKSTRLRSVNGEQIIMSNADILKARVRNFGRLAQRRSLFTLDIHYETPVAALAAVPGAIREIVEATPNTRFERCHLLRLTPTAVQFETVFFVTQADYQAFADAQQAINLRILEKLRALDVAFVATQPTAVRIAPPRDAKSDGAQQRLI